MKKVIVGCCLATMALAAFGQSLEPQQDSWGATMGIGAVTMDGQTWTQIALRPEIPLGKLGIALDLTLYFDEDGDIRKSDWDEAEDLLDKIYYIRWGHKGDPLYLKGGALDDVTLGYGMLVRHYSNATQYPALRRLGGEFEIHPGRLQVEGFVADFRELGIAGGTGLVGLRASYPVIGKLRAGAAYIQDGNLYAKVLDEDGDHVPDPLDRFPDHDDNQEYQLWLDLHNELGEGELWERMRESAGYPGDDWLSNGPEDYSNKSDELRAVTFDLGYELLPNLDLYFQWSQFQDYGSGMAPGITWRPVHWLNAGFEYRVWGDEFIGELFNRSYDAQRTWFDGDSIRTRKDQLASATSMKGFFADASANIFNIVTAYAAFNTMKPDDGDLDSYNSLWAEAKLNLGKVPKLSELSAFYSQTGVKSLFDLATPSTVHGIVLGYEMSPGANMNLTWRTTYNDRNGDGRIRGADERDRTFAVETVFRLH